MADRLPTPGPSFARERIVRLHAGPADPGVAVRVGMSKPTETEDGWWLAHLWAFDADGIIDTRSVAPRSGPPPVPPLSVIGPTFAGALAGLIAEEDGRRLVRLKLHPAVRREPTMGAAMHRPARRALGARPGGHDAHQ